MEFEYSILQDTETRRTYIVASKEYKKNDVILFASRMWHEAPENLAVTFARTNDDGTYDVNRRSGDLWCVTRRSRR